VQLQKKNYLRKLQNCKTKMEITVMYQQWKSKGQDNAYGFFLNTQKLLNGKLTVLPVVAI